jgi:hypothetical protein
MKKPHLNTGAILILILYVVLFFLAAKTIDYYKLILAGTLSLFAFTIISRIKIKEIKTGNETTFNPSEYPWYVAIFIVQFSGYALYKSINHDVLLIKYNNYALLFIFFYFILPAMFFLFILLINKNDRIIINDEYIKWYDNKKEGTVLLKNIKSCEISIKNNLIFFATTKLIIHNIDGSRSTIPTYKMNFTKTGVLQASQLLNSLINK